MLKSILVGTAALAMAGSALAEEKPVQATYTVIEPDVSIRWANSNGTHFQRVDNDTYLIRVSANRWYKAELHENCARGVSGFDPITIHLDGLGTVDTFTQLILDGGRRCRIEKLDRIAPPERPHG
jgi:hypothetical protein